ncbi:hypothetical protein ACFXOS_19805 [Streptomyces sp. NPDC059175]|uniref:hypothetical protein n=1 Tax=Streptomyces sp. NPDC059175 TaxID=3346757 RepID=UPI00369D643E
MTRDPLRDLLDAVLDAIDIPHDTPDHAKYLADRAGIAVIVARAALAEDPADIPRNVDYLRSRLARSKGVQA